MFIFSHRVQSPDFPHPQRDNNACMHLFSSTAPFDWTPGLPYDDSADLAQYLPKARAGKLIEILREAHGWFGKDTQAQALAAAEAEGKGWEDAFDLQPDVPFPERPENMQ